MLAPGAPRRLAPFAAVLLVALAFVAFDGPRRAWPELALAVGVAAVLVFLLVFFRDPERSPGDGIVSAADGRVRAVERTDGRWRISVFLGVLDVHVNRLPIDATLERTEDSGAGYRPAYRAEADRNVRRSYRFATEIGPVEVVQITGIAARRLVSFVPAGWSGRRGERFGMIILGSRVDVLLPEGSAEPVVQVGDRVRAGASPIARRRT